MFYCSYYEDTRNDKMHDDATADSFFNKTD
jgi:hypothetical protein